MRNLPLTVTLCCATFLALPSTAVELVDGGAVSGGIIGGGTDHSGIDSPSNAEKVLFPENASCMNTSCESLGYVKGDVPGCTSYINCPLDATYKACIIYKDCNVTVSNVANRVRRVIVDVLSTTEDKLCDSANLKTDLGADSLDLIELRMALEDEFGRDIPDNTAEGISTIVDIINFFSPSEYIFNLCPANGACEAKFKVVGCKEGYTVSVDDAGRASCTSSCTATLTSCPEGYECTSCTKDGKTYYEKTGNCASGYEEAEMYSCFKETSIIDGSSSDCTWKKALLSYCKKTTCAISILGLPETEATQRHLRSYYLLSSGKIIIQSCDTQYTPVTSTVSGQVCITRCACYDDSGRELMVCPTSTVVGGLI